MRSTNKDSWRTAPWGSVLFALDFLWGAFVCDQVKFTRSAVWHSTAGAPRASEGSRHGDLNFGVSGVPIVGV